jgi:hypothetical protein
MKNQWSASPVAIASRATGATTSRSRPSAVAVPV